MKCFAFDGKELTYGVERNLFPEIKAKAFSFYFCEFIDLKYHPMQIKISLNFSSGSFQFFGSEYEV